MEAYTCNKCLKVSSRVILKQSGRSVLFKDVDGSGNFYGKVCPDCTRERQREYSKKTKGLNHFKYEKTRSGFLVRAYRNIKTRVSAKRYKERRYKDLPVLDKEEFYNWSKASDSFNKLFNCWVEKNYCRKLSPSVDRIDPERGYVLGNIQWITHSENSRKVRPELRYRPKSKVHKPSKG